jgi:RNA polymerase primary sigma factor
MSPKNLDSIKLYLDDVAKIDPLTDEELEDLKPRLRKDDPDARRRLINGSLRLVISIAKKFNRADVDLNDLIEAGNIGLIAASKKYDPDKGTKFSTYAYDWIREYIKRAVLSHTKTIHIPVFLYQDLKKIISAWDKLSKKSGYLPNNKEIAKETGIAQKDIKRFIYYIKVFSDIPSLDAPISKDLDIPLKATLATYNQTEPEDAVGIIGTHQQLGKLLKNIDKRERKIIELRFGVGTSHPHTLHDVGKKLGISRERVRQIQDKALNKLKKAAEGVVEDEE